VEGFHDGRQLTIAQRRSRKSGEIKNVNGPITYRINYIVTVICTEPLPVDVLAVIVTGPVCDPTKVA